MAKRPARAWADAGYERTYSKLFELWPVRSMFEQVIAAAQPTNTTRVLDVGSGTGFLLRGLVAAGLSPAVTELDGSSRMQDQARGLAYGGPVQFVLADLNQPASQWGVAGPFDRCIAVNSLYLVADPAATLRQVATVAAPGARLVVATPKASPDPAAVARSHLEWVASQGGDAQAEYRRLQAEFAGIMASNQAILARSDFHFPDEAELRQWFAAGWSVESVQTTYAGQNWLVVATRERGSNDKPGSPGMEGT